MNTETMLTIFTIVAALGLVAVIAVEVINIQEAEAGCGRGAASLLEHQRNFML
jgi:hypothetical protein